MPFPASLTKLFENNAPYEDFVALFERSPDFIHSQGDSGKTTLHFASKHNRADVLALLLAQGVDKDSTNLKGATPLFVAAQNGHIEIVNALLKAGANKDSANVNGSTPLFIAAQEGHIEIVNALLKSGAHKNKANNQGGTPLFVAAQNGHIEIVKALLQAGADKDKACNDGATALFMAAQKGHIEVVNALLKARANIHLRWKTENITPLLAAALGNNKECFELLLKHPEVTTDMLADIIIDIEVSDAFRLQATTELEKRLPFAGEETMRAWHKCPITQTVIFDPVFSTTDGKYYEKSAINKWLNDHQTSPINRKPTTLKNLFKPLDFSQWIQETCKQLDDAFFASRTTPMDLSSDTRVNRKDLANHRAKFFDKKRKRNHDDDETHQETARNEDTLPGLD